MLRARELRRLFIEDYIIFEHLIRKTARRKINLYKSKNKSLAQIINDLGQTNKENNLKLPMNEIKIHHKIRNWLMHQAANSKCPEKYLEKIKNIKKINSDLKKY